ncbi:MAG: uracil phosphoribosyltransferase [Bacteroidota bacterium]
MNFILHFLISFERFDYWFGRFRGKNHLYMLFVLDTYNSIANNFLSELRDRDRQVHKSVFRNNLQLIGQILAIEISKKLTYKDIEVYTPNGVKRTSVLADDIVLICVLRAAIPFYEGFSSIFQNAESGFIGAARANEANHQDDLEIDLDYISSPDLNDKEILLIDPMLATGKSFIKAMRGLKQFGTPRGMHLCSLISSPEGVENIQTECGKGVNIWTCSIDERLDENLFIVPGLGDAGDLAFGQKI